MEERGKERTGLLGEQDIGRVTGDTALEEKPHEVCAGKIPLPQLFALLD